MEIQTLSKFLNILRQNNVFLRILGNTFNILIATHGIGPAMAMAILSTYSPTALVTVVTSGDTQALTVVPGVGKKTAERLLIELRGKLQLPVLDALVDGKSSGTSVMTDVREALTGLGYSSEEIREVLRDLSATDSAENVLRQALTALGVRRA
jgi:Holliday junction DNA helicase RuvA